MTNDIKPVFQGEIMLAGWQESHTSGAKITFWLPDSDSLEVFKGMTAKKGNISGQRFMAVLVEIGEDEQPVVEQKPKGGELARLAGMWCNDKYFGEWIGAETSDDAANSIYDICEIESRAELDNNLEAAERFHRLIRIPYSQWLKEHGC